jgi:methylenetetrahydrofolate--tRNA-(uracil-5-)-methyltransferase
VKIRVIGGGLAGPEAALTAARLGCEVELYEMRAMVDGKPRLTPAHQTMEFGELVCSNSLKSETPYTAPWLLKQEMRRGGSALLRIADETAVPAGHALAVDRVEFSRRITEAIEAEPKIRVVREEVTDLGTSLDQDENSAKHCTIVATGPLTSDALSGEIERLTGAGHLAFYDSISPIVDAESIEMSRVYFAARWDKGTADYINCPMDRAEYDRFLDALLTAEAAESKEWEKLEYFEGCLPIEVLARRGRDTLRFGPMKPVGLRDPRTGKTPWAVVQLRKENLRADSYNLVGFQNHLKFGEQAKVLRLIPGLENARFLRYGQIHRNTYICAPALLDECLRLKGRRACCLRGRFAGWRGIPNRLPRECWRGSTRRLWRGAKSRCPCRARRPSDRWSTTSRTPIKRIFSRPTSPSTCSSLWISTRSTRRHGSEFGTRRSDTGWFANERWRHSTSGGQRSGTRQRNFARRKCVNL